MPGGFSGAMCLHQHAAQPQLLQPPKHVHHLGVSACFLRCMSTLNTVPTGGVSYQCFLPRCVYCRKPEVATALKKLLNDGAEATSALQDLGKKKTQLKSTEVSMSGCALSLVWFPQHMRRNGKHA